MMGRLALLLATAGLSLTACSEPATGLAFAGSDAPYFDSSSCWDSFDAAYELPYCGWYDGFFYPGSGIYVYGRDRHPHIWSDGQKNYWSQRRESFHGQSTSGARGALGIGDGNSVSRPVMPHEMGMGMPGFSGRFAMPRGGMSGRTR